MSSHTDKAGELLSPDQVDVENVLNDIHADRQKYTKQQISNSATSSKEMVAKRVLPECTINFG